MRCNVKECKKDHEIYDALTLTPEEKEELDTSIHHLLKEGFAGATEDSTTIKEWYYPLTPNAEDVREDFDSEDEEEYHCTRCDKKIVEVEYLENTGLCRHCVRAQPASLPAR